MSLMLHYDLFIKLFKSVIDEAGTRWNECMGTSNNDKFSRCYQTSVKELRSMCAQSSSLKTTPRSTAQC